MIFNKLHKVIAASILSLTSYTAQADESDMGDIDFKAITRIDTKISDGAYKQKLPNIVTIVKSKNWETQAAIKIDNIDDKQKPPGDHNARLLFLNGNYKCLQNHGTNIKIGLFAPNELTQHPLINGFTSVIMDDYALYGGIVGLKVDQKINFNDGTTLKLNGGAGYKPEWLERFGSSGDTVIFSGIDLKHVFSNSAVAEAGYEYIDFSSDNNPEGTDHYTYGKLKIYTNNLRYELYGENIRGKRCTNTTCSDTDRHNLSASIMTRHSSQTDWRIAAGLNNGQENIEISAYHELNKNLHAVTGIGHNFETNNDVIQLGLIKVF